MEPKKFINSPYFGRIILGVIIFNAFLIGLSTYIQGSSLIHNLEWVCIWIFVVELALKFYARDNIKSFFSNGWNIFDIIVVGSAFNFCSF